MKKIFLFLVSAMSAVCAFAQSVISIDYSGSTATVTIPESITDVVCTSGTSSNVVLTSTTALNEYTYKLTGATTDGSLLINGSYKLTLELAGVSITSKSRYAIDIECGKRIAVILDEGTTNTLADAEGGSQKGAFYFKGHPEFEGEGTLNVTANTKHAIYAKEYVEFKSSLGTINVLRALGDAIHCNDKGQTIDNYFLMNGGILNISNIEGDGIDTGTFGTAEINAGNVSIELSVLDTKGIKTDGELLMTGGALNILVSGDDCDALSSKGNITLNGGTATIIVKGDGSKGLRSTLALGATEGGNITLAGTDLTIYANGGNFITVDNVAKCQALNADGAITHTAGTVEIYAYGPEAKTYSADGELSINEESFFINRAPWTFCPYDYQHDMTVLYSIDLPDATIDQYAVGAFIGDECVGVGIDGYLRIYSNDTNAQNITFKAYDYTVQRECSLAPSEEITFVPNKRYGTYSAPILLSSLLAGDVNMDGLVDVRDVVLMVNYINNGAAEPFNFPAADLNHDGSITEADIQLLNDIILQK